MSKTDPTVPMDNSGPGKVIVKGPTPSGWPGSLRSGSGEALKNWSAFFMGLAALVTSLGISFKPQDNAPNVAWEEAKIEIRNLSQDLKRTTLTVNRLISLRNQDESRRKIISELERSAYDIEDKLLREELTRTRGKVFADKYMDARAKHRDEIRLEYIRNTERNIPPFISVPDERILPPFGERKERNSE